MREEDRESVWRRDDKETSGVLKEKFERMVKVLKAAMHQERDSKDANEYVFDRKNIKSMFDVLEYVSTKSDLGTNLSKNKFYEWHNGKRTKMLPDEFDQLIDGMYDKYVMGAEKRRKERFKTRIQRTFQKLPKRKRKKKMKTKRILRR